MTRDRIGRRWAAAISEAILGLVDAQAIRCR